MPPELLRSCAASALRRLQGARRCLAPPWPFSRHHGCRSARPRGPFSIAWRSCALCSDFGLTFRGRAAQIGTTLWKEHSSIALSFFFEGLRHLVLDPITLDRVFG